MIVHSGTGRSTSGANGSESANTITPAMAERPASYPTDASTGPAGMPSRLVATTRAAGVQTPPGMYFASIDSISAPSASAYPMRMSSARRIDHPADHEDR